MGEMGSFWCHISPPFWPHTSDRLHSDSRVPQRRSCDFCYNRVGVDTNQDLRLSANAKEVSAIQQSLRKGQRRPRYLLFLQLLDISCTLRGISSLDLSAGNKSDSCCSHDQCYIGLGMTMRFSTGQTLCTKSFYSYALQIMVYSWHKITVALLRLLPFSPTEGPSPAPGPLF